MAITVKQMSIIVGALGIISFLFGIFAELNKPPAGTAIPGKGVVICKYPSDPTVALGYLSVVFLIASNVAGYFSLFYPYKGKSIPQALVFQSTKFVVYFNIALGTAGLAAALLLWPTIQEQVHHSQNVHKDLETECPTAKKGMLGGAAFVSLDASLFWLICLMLVSNVREDYFDDLENDRKGTQLTQEIPTDF